MNANHQAQWAPSQPRDRIDLLDLDFRGDPHRSFHGMIGETQSSRAFFETIRRVGPSDYPVLITGESGTGKELAAVALHRESRRKSGPFVPVNCGALPEGILESELFGHVRGAFTGAGREKNGRFSLAHTGTIFLDEVGDISPRMQIILLRVLESSTFEPVGAERSVTVDIRILAATHRILKDMVGEGTFREDLYYRLCVIPLTLLPLRERKADIPYIAASIFDKIKIDTGKEVRFIGRDAMAVLQSHFWPGNVRELIHSLQFASIKCVGNVILSDDLPREIGSSQKHPGRNDGRS